MEKEIYLCKKCNNLISSQLKENIKNETINLNNIKENINICEFIK